MHTDLTKRSVLKAACGCSIAAATAVLTLPTAAAAGAHEPAPSGMTPDQALALLKKGNESFVADHPAPPQLDRKRRLEIAKGQHPFAVLVGCSDSRVSPEHLFGRGLGDRFIVRVAGNTVDLTALGSIEYAVEHLGVPLIVVLGHERCGAVAAAISVVKENATHDRAIGAMVAPILPAVLKCQNQPGDILENSVRENARRVASQLAETGPVIGKKLTAGKLKIVSAHYDLDEGKVEFLS